MIVLDENLILDDKDTLTHLRYPFIMDRDYKAIKINLDYDPSDVPKEYGKQSLKECVDKYMPEEDYSQEDRDDILNSKIANLLTTSLLYEGKFVGAYHNKANQQEIIVSKDKSSPGYKKFDIKKGNYEFILSMHSSNSKINAHFSLEAIDD